MNGFTYYETKHAIFAFNEKTFPLLIIDYSEWIISLSLSLSVQRWNILYPSVDQLQEAKYQLFFIFFIQDWKCIMTGILYIISIRPVMYEIPGYNMWIPFLVSSKQCEGQCLKVMSSYWGSVLTADVMHVCQLIWTVVAMNMGESNQWHMNTIQCHKYKLCLYDGIVLYMLFLQVEKEKHQENSKSSGHILSWISLYLL